MSVLFASSPILEGLCTNPKFYEDHLRFLVPVRPPSRAPEPTASSALQWPSAAPHCRNRLHRNLFIVFSSAIEIPEDQVHVLRLWDPRHHLPDVLVKPSLHAALIADCHHLPGSEVCLWPATPRLVCKNTRKPDMVAAAPPHVLPEVRPLLQGSCENHVVNGAILRLARLESQIGEALLDQVIGVYGVL